MTERVTILGDGGWGTALGIVLSDHGADVAQLSDYCLSVGPDGLPDLYRPMLDVMLGQLIGLFASMRCGLKPDQPSPTGTITRVVQPIAIYS